MIHHTPGPTFHPSPSAAARAPSVWPRWPLQVVLAILFLGPLAAPLFQATRLWPLADAGALARDLLAHYVCPTPLKSYTLAGFPMAVCARCWGATIGLWLSYAALGGSSRPPAGVGRASWWRRAIQGFRRLPLPARTLAAAAPFLLWVAEIQLWPGAPLPLLLANGALAGFSAGLLFCSLWPGLGARSE